MAAICYEVEAVVNPVRLIVQSELVANEDRAQVSGDPRQGEVLKDPLEAVLQDHERQGALLVHRTRRSGLLVAAGMDHVVDAPDAVVEQDIREHWARTWVACTLQPGQRLRLVKFLAYGWSARRTGPPPCAIRSLPHSVALAWPAGPGSSGRGKSPSRRLHRGPGPERRQHTEGRCASTASPTTTTLPRQVGRSARHQQRLGSAGRLRREHCGGWAGADTRASGGHRHLR